MLYCKNKWVKWSLPENKKTTNRAIDELEADDMSVGKDERKCYFVSLSKHIVELRNYYSVDIYEHSGYIQLDFDHVGDKKALKSFWFDFLLPKVKDYRHSAYISPSGDGIKLVIKIEALKGCSAQMALVHKVIFDKLHSLFDSPFFDEKVRCINKFMFAPNSLIDSNMDSKRGIDVDIEGIYKDIKRGRYNIDGKEKGAISEDTKGAISEEKGAITQNNEKRGIIGKTSEFTDIAPFNDIKKGALSLHYNSTSNNKNNAMIMPLSQKESKKGEFVKGNRNNFVFAKACENLKNGEDPSHLLDLAEEDFTREEIQRTIDSARKSFKESFRKGFEKGNNARTIHGEETFKHYVTYRQMGLSHIEACKKVRVKERQGKYLRSRYNKAKGVIFKGRPRKMPQVAISPPDPTEVPSTPLECPKTQDKPIEKDIEKELPNNQGENMEKMEKEHFAEAGKIENKIAYEAEKIGVSEFCGLPRTTANEEYEDDFSDWKIDKDAFSDKIADFSPKKKKPMPDVEEDDYDYYQGEYAG